MFPNKDPKSWTLANEIAKTRKLNSARGKIDDDSIDCTKLAIPTRIEDHIFKNMSKGNVVHDMDQARELEREMKAVILSKPRYPDNVWKVMFYMSICA